MIKYLGSKRVLVPVLGEVFAASRARTALDLFTGTTRVAQEICRRSLRTTGPGQSRVNLFIAEALSKDGVGALSAIPGNAPADLQ